MKFEIQAEVREGSGRADSRKLRRLGRVPAIVYGGGKDPSAITLERNSLVQQMAQEAFYTSILNVKLGSRVQPVVVKEVQRHPAKSTVLHLDFQRVVEDQEIRMNVPLHFLGEEVAIGVKQGGGKVSHLRTDVEVVCLPRFLPEYLEVDISALELDEMLYLSDIKLPEGVTLTELAQGADHDYPIVSIHVIKEVVIEEEVEEAGVIAAGEVPTAAEEKEGAESAEGEDSDED